MSDLHTPIEITPAELNWLQKHDPRAFDEMNRLLAWEKTERERERCEGSLIEFLISAWEHIGESGSPAINWHHEAIADQLEALARGELETPYGPTRSLVVNQPPRTTKALDCDTPILTTWGWKRHGDLQPGDFVFGPDGQPKRVTGVSPITRQPAFELSFDEKSTIIASGEHLWAIDRDYPYGSPTGHRCRKPAVVMTTELHAAADYKDETVEGQRKRNKHRCDRICAAQALNLPPRRFLIHPYILGAWLGDGTSASAMITVGDQDIEHFRQFGEATQYPNRIGNPVWRLLIPELQTKLRILGLLGNKHVPDDYLEASIEQRWELLRGLMDTDGHASTRDGVCGYTSKLYHLAEQVQRLANSLGLKAGLRETWSAINGERCGPYFSVFFVAAPDMPHIFKLARKQACVQPSVNSRSRGRYLQTITQVEDRDVNCIKVEGELYLAGRSFITTHNTSLISICFPAWIWAQPRHRQGPLMGPHVKFLCVSYGATLAEEIAVKSRRLILSEWYQRLWGERVHLREDQGSRANFANTAGGERLSNSIEGGILGRGGDIQIIDDPHHLKGAESDQQRRETLEGMRSLVTRVTDPRRAARVLVMQRLHLDDSTTYALDHWDNPKLIMFAMRFDIRRGEMVPEDDRNYDPETGHLTIDREGELLWPEVWTPKVVIQEERELGEYGTSGQLQQEPISRGGGIIKRAWWRLWPDDAEREGGFTTEYKCLMCGWGTTIEPVGPSVECAVCGRAAERRVVFPDTSYRILSVDTAYSEEDQTKNSWNAATRWGIWHDKDEAPRTILMEAWRGRPPLRTGKTQAGERGLIEQIDFMAMQGKVDVVLIEKKTRGVDLYHELEQLLSDRPYRLEFFEPTGRGDKVARLTSVSGFFTSDMVWAPDKDWAGTVIDEIIAQPRAQFSDLTDTISSALLYLRETGLLRMKYEHDADKRRSMMFRSFATPSVLTQYEEA